MVCVIGIVVAGAMMAVGQRRGEGGEHASRLGWVIAGCIVIGAASGIVNLFI
jgi:type IV secretory pathway VirB2 component (pilin)